MSEFNQKAIDRLNRLAAQKIFEKMRNLRMLAEENSKRRWIWELLQNAKDKAAIDFSEEKVSIVIDYNESLEFQHNFGYFTVANVEGLIQQISSEDKDRDNANLDIRPQTTGRFGTGFITTHLLSEQVEVKGIYQKEDLTFSKICFPLDRSGRDLKELIASISYSFECAEKSLSQSESISEPAFSEFNTVFTYKLDEQGREIAEIGLQDLENALPYTLIFIDRINSVKTTQAGQSTVYEKVGSRNLTEKIKLIEFNRVNDGIFDKLYYIYLSENLTSIAIPIALDNDQIGIIPFNQHLPRLFLDFPLIGTENFSFPAIINNPFLEPTEPRDGIFLTDKNESHVIHNKEIIQEAVSLYLSLLEYASNHSWQNLYFLANTKLPQEKDWISQTWYRDNVQSVLRNNLLNSEIVYTDDLENPKIKLQDALFPFSSSLNKALKVWDFAKLLWFDRLPQKDHLEFWFEIIDKTWPDSIRYGIKNLANDIANLSSLEQLCDRISKAENETLVYLTDVIEFINQDNSKLLDDFAIIPNQYNNFKRKGELWLDDNIPNQLKDILELLGDNWRANLKHSQITIANLAITKNLSDIVNRINPIIREKDNPNIQSAILHLLSCSPPESKNTNEICQLRKQVWQFASDFYPETPKQKYLGNWDKTIWQECDKYFIQELFTDIASKETISELNNHLQQDAHQWLSNLINFVVEKDFSINVTNAKIIPDQQGNLQKISNLFLDPDIDETLKDILEELGYNCRSELIDNSITLSPSVVSSLNIKTKSISEIASEISKRVEEILKDEGLSQSRTEKDRKIFAQLFIWFNEHESLAKEFFSPLYEKRHRLQTDEEIISNMKFKADILNNSNGYNEEEILELVNTPKDQLMVLPENISSEEVKQLIEKYQQEKIATENQKYQSTDSSDELSPEELKNLLLSLAIDSPEELENAQSRFCGSYMGRCLARIAKGYNFEHVQAIIARAKRNIQKYLSQHPDYDCTNWCEESKTVINGVTKKGRSIKLVLRPSDGGKVHLYYDNEITALESPDAELWIDDNQIQRILTLGQILRYTGIHYIKL
jgi:hypothetical protein